MLIFAFSHSIGIRLVLIEKPRFCSSLSKSLTVLAYVSYFVRSVNLHAAASLYVVILPAIFSFTQAHHGYIVLKLRSDYNYFIHFSHILFIVYFYDVKC